MSMPISGFTAVYNPQMMAMMPIQSFIMMYEAGQGWQFGKRKISEMSNEQIKALTPIKLMEMNNQVRRDAIPIIERAMNEIAPITRHMVTNFADIVKEFIRGVGDVGSNIFQQSFQGANNPYGNLTNVRLSQGSQQFQRDRELYAGGAPSLYEQDIQRKQQRDYEASFKQTRQEQIDRANAIKLGAPLPSIHKTVTTGVTRQQFVKPKAGQTQIQARARLQKSVVESGKKFKRYNVPRVAGLHPVTLAKFRKNAKRKLQQDQHNLIQLVNRYRW